MVVLLFCAGSGGWSDPKPNAKGIPELPVFQLYDLAVDPRERTNLFGQHPEIENQLSELMLYYIDKGRSTPGVIQSNEPNGFGTKEWNQFIALKQNIQEK